MEYHERGRQGEGWRGKEEEERDANEEKKEEERRGGREDERLSSDIGIKNLKSWKVFCLSVLMDRKHHSALVKLVHICTSSLVKESHFSLEEGNLCFYRLCVAFLVPNTGRKLQSGCVGF